MTPQQGVATRVVGVPDVTTTVVVTATSVGLARETWARGGPGSRIKPARPRDRGDPLGAVAGALLLRVHTAVPCALATACTPAVALLGHRHLRGVHSPPASV